MDTIPPAGVSPTRPPDPERRARFALGLSLVGVALFVAALTLSLGRGQEVAVVFAYANDAELVTLFGRLLFGASGAAHLVAIASASLSLRMAPKTSVAALAISVIWIASVCAWLIARS